MTNRRSFLKAIGLTIFGARVPAFVTPAGIEELDSRHEGFDCQIDDPTMRAMARACGWISLIMDGHDLGRAPIVWHPEELTNAEPIEFPPILQCMSVHTTQFGLHLDTDGPAMIVGELTLANLNGYVLANEVVTVQRVGDVQALIGDGDEADDDDLDDIYEDVR